MKISKVEITMRRYPKMRFNSYPNGRQTPDLRNYNADRREFRDTTRVYVMLDHTESILENIENRRSRPYKQWKPLVEKELRDAGYEGKVRWSQSAGCKMCPCSPGFVLEVQMLDENMPFDIWMTITD